MIVKKESVLCSFKVLAANLDTTIEHLEEEHGAYSLAFSIEDADYTDEGTFVTCSALVGRIEALHEYDCGEDFCFLLYRHATRVIQNSKNMTNSIPIGFKHTGVKIGVEDEV